MIREYQKTPDSCFAACVASIIEWDVDAIPKCFHAATWDHYEQRRWLRLNGWGLAEHKLTPDSMWPPTDGMICILSGKSPRRDCQHAVVAQTQYDTGAPFVAVHDPMGIEINLDCPFEGDATIVTWLIPLNELHNPQGQPKPLFEDVTCGKRRSTSDEVAEQVRLTPRNQP